MQSSKKNDVVEKICKKMSAIADKKILNKEFNYLEKKHKNHYKKLLITFVELSLRYLINQFCLKFHYLLIKSVLLSMANHSQP